ncbi:hypothetical protein PsYK624_150050 [Phanerochaete sordida]|uniref:Uncharacterized protein n=1 Tax=Phanerochaete sordida TaxID=48140 RepID=A0A9P3LLJ8_9APHY|nr:hypothetical protein PsYK624_150050 [Phanerochaete sordida]
MPRNIPGQFYTILQPRPTSALRSDVIFIDIEREQHTATPASPPPTTTTTTTTVTAVEVGEDDEETMYENHDNELIHRLRLLNIGTDPHNYERLRPRWHFELAPQVPLDPMGQIITEWLIIVIGMYTGVFPGYMWNMISIYVDGFCGAEFRTVGSYIVAITIWKDCCLRGKVWGSIAPESVVGKYRRYVPPTLATYMQQRECAAPNSPISASSAADEGVTSFFVPHYDFRPLPLPPRYTPAPVQGPTPAPGPPPPVDPVEDATRGMPSVRRQSPVFRDLPGCPPYTGPTAPGGRPYRETYGSNERRWGRPDGSGSDSVDSTSVTGSAATHGEATERLWARHICQQRLGPPGPTGLRCRYSNSFWVVVVGDEPGVYSTLHSACDALGVDPRARWSTFTTWCEAQDYFLDAEEDGDVVELS